MKNNTTQRVTSYFAFLFVLFLFNINAFASLNVPLTVTDYAGVDRVGEPVTSGIPLPEHLNIKDQNTLQIIDANGNPVPRQFKVFARWHGTPNDATKPIKWMLLDFQANVPPNGTTTYYLRRRGSRPSSTNLTVTEDTDFVTVDTGRISFKINKNNFNLFDIVTTGNKEIISSSLENGFEVTDHSMTLLIRNAEAGSNSFKVTQTSYYSPGDKFVIHNGKTLYPRNTGQKAASAFICAFGHYQPTINVGDVLIFEPGTQKEESNKIMCIGTSCGSCPGGPHTDSVRFEHPFQHAHPRGSKTITPSTEEEYTITNIEGNTIFFRPALKSKHYAGEAIDRMPLVKAEFRSSLDKPQVTVEQNGPQKVVIKVRGAFRSTTRKYLGQLNDYDSRLSQPYPWVNYTMRIIAYDNKDYVRVFFTFENNGCWGGWPDNKYCSPQVLIFDSLSLNLRLNLGETKTISTDNYTDSYKQEEFHLYQTLKNNEFSYNIMKDGIQKRQGGRSKGWIDMNDGEKGILAGIRYFWQNYPKGIRFKDNTLSLNLWPEEGGYPRREDGRGDQTYGYAGGRHKTYEMLFRFYNGSAQLTENKNLVEAQKQPLFALAPPEWYADSMTLGMIAPDGLIHPDPELNEALQRFEKMQSAKVYIEDSQQQGEVGPATIYSAREGWKHRLYYGWMNFGDLWWADGYCSLHYDWPYSMLLHFIRSGKRKFFDMGTEMAKHRCDIDQYHGERTDSRGEHKWNNYLQRYEKDGHGILGGYTPKMSHTWNGGLVLYYLLTGDEKAWEAAQEVGRAAFENYGPKYAGGGMPSEYRFQAWCMLNLMNIYLVNGNHSYLNMARDIAKNSLLKRERKLVGGKGHFQNPNKESLVMFGYVIESLIYAHFYTQDQDILDLLIRMNSWLENECIYGGHYEGKKYMPLQTPYIWTPEAKGGEIIRGFFLADLPAYLYLKTNNSEYLEFARNIFKDSVFYWQCGGNTLYDPTVRSKVTYTPRQFPGSHTKVGSWTGRGHQIYLYVERQLQKKGKSGTRRFIKSTVPRTDEPGA